MINNLLDDPFSNQNNTTSQENTDLLD